MEVQDDVIISPKEGCESCWNCTVGNYFEESNWRVSHSFAGSEQASHWQLLSNLQREGDYKKAIIRHRRLCLRTMYLHEDLVEKYFSGGEKNPSVCSKVVFIKKQPIIAKALFWHLRVLCRGCCVHLLSDFHDNSDAYLRAPTLKITSTHTAGYKFSLLNCGLISWNLTITTPLTLKHLHSKSLSWFLTFLRKPLNTNIWHLKPTGLKCHYKHSSFSSVLTKKFLIDKLPALFANWSQFLLWDHPNLQVKSTKQNQLGEISVLFRNS